MANLYTIENLLIGKTYNSKTLRGEIIDAEKDIELPTLDPQLFSNVERSQSLA